MGLKNGEKKSMALYYSYRKTEFKYLNGEQLKNIIMCLLELDEKGKIEDEAESFEAIQSDNLASAMFDVMREKTERASREWWQLYENKQKSKEQTAEVPAEGKTAPAEVPTPKKIESKEDEKGPFWLFGSDYEVENDETAIRDEITADEWINDPNLTFDYQNGELFKWILKHKISRNKTACEVVREYMKTFYDYESL